MAFTNPLTLGPDELVQFVLKYEESCGASSTTSGSNKNFPYPERLFGSIESVSTDTDLKKIYKRMAIKLHPDKNTHAEASNAFQVLQSCFEATLTIIEAGGSAAGPGKGAGGGQQQQQKAPPQQQQKTSTKSSRAQAPPPHASFTPEQQAYAARQQAYAAKQQAKAAYEEACRKAQPSSTSQSSQNHQGTSAHKATSNAAPQDDYDPEWDDWTEKKEKKSKTSGATSSGYAPPPQASKPSAEDWKDAEAAFAPSPTDAADTEDIEYWWDEDNQMYYYLDSKTGEYAWYDEEAEKKKRKAEKKRAKERTAASTGGGGDGGGDEYLPGFDLSSDEEGEARLKKIEKHFKKRRRTKMAELNAARKQRGGHDDDDDDSRDPLKMNLDLSDDEIVGAAGGNGGVDVDDEELFGDDPDMLALLAEKVELEKKLNRIRRRKKAAEKERVEAEKVVEKAKTKKSAASLASLFQRFGIADEDDEDYEAMYGSAKPKKKDNSYKNILLDDEAPTTTKKTAPAAASAMSGSASSSSTQQHQQYAPPPVSSSPVYEQPSSPISMGSSPPDSTTFSKPTKMSPAQILAEKRRIAAAAKMNNAGVGSTGGGSYKFQVTCPNCHNYKVTLAKDAADKAIMCTMCNSYFVPSQQIASTAHAVVSGSKASTGGGAKVIRSQLQDRCSCGRARKGGCFMCGD